MSYLKIEKHKNNLNTEEIKALKDYLLYRRTRAKDKEEKEIFEDILWKMYRLETRDDDDYLELLQGCNNYNQKLT